MATTSFDEMSLAELKEAAEAAERAAAEPTETVYRRVVGGVEYTSDSLEGLMDVVAAAAETVQQEVAKSKPAPAAPSERTPDEEFVRSQELQTSPTKTVRQIVAEEIGVPVGDVKSRMAKLAEYEANAAAEQFVAATPDYFATPRNGALIQKAMQEANMPCTVDNIRTVYTSLRDKGLLVERPAEIDPYAIDLETLKNLALERESTEIDF